MEPNSELKIDNTGEYILYNPLDYPTPRQGGDTYVDAIPIDALPFVITGTTAGTMIIMMKSVLTQVALLQMLFTALLLQWILQLC